mmetsp:Transcript_31355/g.73918  ORF Transcript_31355/g.73918 Transcript_31355/m.73918 type:complete len:261 (+) Transcript_31355:466-1248(+)
MHITSWRSRIMPYPFFNAVLYLSKKARSRRSWRLLSRTMSARVLTMACLSLLDALACHSERKKVLIWRFFSLATRKGWPEAEPNLTSVAPAGSRFATAAPLLPPVPSKPIFGAGSSAMRLFMWASLLQFSEITTAAPRVIRCGHTSSYPWRPRMTATTWMPRAAASCTSVCPTRPLAALMTMTSPAESVSKSDSIRSAAHGDTPRTAAYSMGMSLGTVIRSSSLISACDLHVPAPTGGSTQSPGFNPLTPEPTSSTCATP